MKITHRGSKHRIFFYTIFTGIIVATLYFVLGVRNLSVRIRSRSLPRGVPSTRVLERRAAAIVSSALSIRLERTPAQIVGGSESDESDESDSDRMDEVAVVVPRDVSGVVRWLEDALAAETTDTARTWRSLYITARLTIREPVEILPVTSTRDMIIYFLGNLPEMIEVITTIQANMGRRRNRISRQDCGRYMELLTDLHDVETNIYYDFICRNIRNVNDIRDTFGVSEDNAGHIFARAQYMLTGRFDLDCFRRRDRRSEAYRRANDGAVLLANLWLRSIGIIRAGA